MKRSDLSSEFEATSRRRFLQVSGGLAAAALVLPASSWNLGQPGMAPWFRISLAQWSLHRALFEGRIDHLDFARVSMERFGIDAVEYVNQFFKDKADHDAYIDDMKKRAEDHGVRSLLIMIDGEGAVGDPDAGKRAETVRRHRKWVRAAARLGCHSIRVNAESSGEADEQARLVADGLRALTEYAAAHDLNVIVENHGGLSCNGGWLADVMRRVDHPRCGTLPDFGNFRIREGEAYDRYKGVDEMMPFAHAVSAKSYAFDADGNESTIDFERMLTIVRRAGYRGWIGVEYEGDAHSEDEGIRLTRDLLVRLRDQLAASE